MRKYILTLVLAFTIIPQIAFASWWNPISWFDGWNQNNQSKNNTQILEKRIYDLEKKIENKEEVKVPVIENKKDEVLIKKEIKSWVKGFKSDIKKH